MQVKYRIIKVHPEEHSITVRYYTDVLTEDKLAQNFDTFGNIVRNPDGSPTHCRTDYFLNIFRVPAPTEEELDAFIKQCIPLEWFKMQEAIANSSIDTSMSNILHLVGVEKSTNTDVVEANTSPVQFVRTGNTETTNTGNT